jgi:cation transport ATPase
MIQTYHISGMTCSGCQAKVQQLLSSVNGVKKAEINLAKAEATIEMEDQIPFSTLKNALQQYPAYQLTEQDTQKQVILPVEEEKKTWIETYKPILLIFGYILGITLLMEVKQGNFELMRWMQHFMAGFFIVFSFFKFINLKGFADSYAMYDILAKQWKPWAYLYAFVELALGLAFLTGFNPVITNIVTLIVMLISITGVLQSLLNKRKIKCACLGAVFNLPMSTITVIEDSLMIIMSAGMLFYFL